MCKVIILQNYVPNCRSSIPPKPISTEELKEIIDVLKEAAPEVHIQIPVNLNFNWDASLDWAYSFVKFFVAKRGKQRHMKIGIVGGTGSFGKGLACRWAKNHTIFVGSRLREKGKQKAREYQAELEKFGITGSLAGASNKDVIAGCEMIVLAVHFEHLFSLVEESYTDFGNKIVISPIVSLKKEESFRSAPPEEGSVALLLQKRLPHSMIVSALHTVPANRLSKLDKALEGDVPVCGNSQEAKERAMGLIREIERLNPINAGPLDVSIMIEPIVPLILNLKQYSLKRNTCIKFI